MMNKFILILLSIIAFGCTSKAPQSSNGLENEIENALFIENLDSIPLPTIEGDFQFGYRWNDSLGSNLIVFTLDKTFTKEKDIADPLVGAHRVSFHIYHFLGENHNELLSYYTDRTESCNAPNATLIYNYIKESVTFTDLNNNGIAEITFMHQYNCSSKTSPLNTKLTLMENDSIYNISGNSFLKSEYPNSGIKKFEPSFESAPSAFKKHANEVWETFCKSNPKLAAKSKIQKQLITPAILKQLTFVGTEPFWDITMSDSSAVYHSVDGDSVIMNFTKNGITGSYSLSDVIETISTTEIKIQIVAGGISGLMTIRNERCSDGMSDTEYPYSFSLIWNEEEGALEGCGVIIQDQNPLEK
ncbi:MAG: hypothetical protein PHU27_03430 [Salinivirgaceae bacterium]|nr:hypothetical protein [Salinivirgaceae bacterium]